MKIAQVAPLIESVPPALYGGTERATSYITEELVRQGHDVTLFASGDSKTMAKLDVCSPSATRLSQVDEHTPYYTLMIDKVRQRADEFDIIHFHIDYLQFPIFRDIAHKTLTTLHSRQEAFPIQSLYREFSQYPLVSISDYQRHAISYANFVSTIYHGLPPDLHTVTLKPKGGYLAFLGRICPEKRPDRAIAIALAAGVPLKIAAKVDKIDTDYYRDEIKPLITRNNSMIEYIGEINESQKTEFLGQASALLFPIDWAEPFGLVMIEAMACGTPTVGFRLGSVPEVIDEGITGTIVNTIGQAVAAVPKVLELDRAKIRNQFDKRFSAVTMTKQYVNTYQSLLDTAK